MHAILLLEACWAAAVFVDWVGPAVHELTSGSSHLVDEEVLSSSSCIALDASILEGNSLEVVSDWMIDRQILLCVRANRWRAGAENRTISKRSHSPANGVPLHPRMPPTTGFAAPACHWG